MSIFLPVREDSPRPFWSVMIPAYRPKIEYLRQTLESVLQQKNDSGKMQIEVVDDCSPDVAVDDMVKEIAGQEVSCFRSPTNLGLANCWNACIGRSRGRWVHILHQDDFVLPGFYRRLGEAARLHPQVSLLAARSFLVDDEGIISGITERVKELEAGGGTVDRFFYHTPIQCPGVVVKREFYESHGGFLPSLVSGLDCEMWARAIGIGGGLVTQEALACYRFYYGGETGRLARSAEILADTVRMNKIFAERYPSFDVEKSRKRVLDMAMDLTSHFTRKGDMEAAKNNLNFWKANAPLKLQLRRLIEKSARKVLE